MNQKKKRRCKTEFGAGKNHAADEERTLTAPRTALPTAAGCMRRCAAAEAARGTRQVAAWHYASHLQTPCDSRKPIKRCPLDSACTPVTTACDNDCNCSRRFPHLECVKSNLIGCCCARQEGALKPLAGLQHAIAWGCSPRIAIAIAAPSALRSYTPWKNAL